MTAPGYDVDPEQLRSHAGVLDGYADRLATIGNGLPDSVAEQSLGSFAQFLATGLGGAMTETLNAFGHASSVVDKVASGVLGTANSYQRTDGDNSTALT